MLAPVMVLIALAVKLDSRGPVLFRQRRVGRGGKRFQVLKFRTMVVDAEKLQSELLYALAGPALAEAGSRSQSDARRRIPAANEPRRVAAALERAQR